MIWLLKEKNYSFSNQALYKASQQYMTVEENDIDNMTTSNELTSNGNGRNDSKGGKIF